MDFRFGSTITKQYIAGRKEACGSCGALCVYVLSKQVRG